MIPGAALRASWPGPDAALCPALGAIQSGQPSLFIMGWCSFPRCEMCGSQNSRRHLRHSRWKDSSCCNLHFSLKMVSWARLYQWTPKLHWIVHLIFRGFFSHPLEHMWHTQASNILPLLPHLPQQHDVGMTVWLVECQDGPDCFRLYYEWEQED